MIASEPSYGTWWRLVPITSANTASSTRRETGLFLATAHPAKFKESLEPVLGREIPLPGALAELLDRPLLAEPMENDAESLKRRLRATGSAGVPPAK